MWGRWEKTGRVNPGYTANNLGGGGGGGGHSGTEWIPTAKRQCGAEAVTWEQ